jgi:ParB family chromosome partitioning protein
MNTKQSKLQALAAAAAASSQPLDSIFDAAENTLQSQKTGHSSNSFSETKTTFSRETSGAEANEIEAVSLSIIDENPLNARRIYKSERVKAMAAALATDGQLQPGLAIKKGDRYVLIAGHYRLRGLKQAGKQTMDLIIKDNLSDQQIYKLSYSENKERNDQSPLDDALAWRKLLDDKVFALDRDLAEAVGKKPAMVSKTLSIAKISKEAQCRIEEAPESDGEGSPYPEIAFTVLYAYAQLEAVLRNKNLPITIALDALDKALIGRITREQIDLLRHNIETGKVRKGKETSKQYKVSGNCTGVFKDFADSGRVEVKITIKDPQVRQSLIEELCRRFQHEVLPNSE